MVFQRDDEYLGLYPWVWIEFESREPAGAFSFLDMVTAHRWPLDTLNEKVGRQGCCLLQSDALDLFREPPGGRTKPLLSVAPSSLDLYRPNHNYPFLPQGSLSYGVLSPG